MDVLFSVPQTILNNSIGQLQSLGVTIAVIVFIVGVIIMKVSTSDAGHGRGMKIMLFAAVAVILIAIGPSFVQGIYAAAGGA